MKLKNLLFIHDGPIYYDGEGKYYEYSYPHLEERYGFLAENISFLMRVFPLTNSTRGNVIPSDIRIIAIPNICDVKKYFHIKKEVKQIIERNLINVDMVVVRGSIVGHMALKYIKKRKIPYIYECVGCVWDSFWNHGLVGKILAPYMYFSTKRIIANSEYVYYVTNEFLQKRYPTNGCSVGCSNVYLDSVKDAVLNKRLKKNENLLNTEKIILGTAAALDVRYKGQEYVIKAMPMLIKKGYDVEYWLAGGNRKKSDYLEKVSQEYGVSNRVKFLGSLNSEEIKEFYDNVDIYVQPSKQEGLPRALIEAMNRGCLAIGSSIAGIPELLEPKFLFKKGNSKAIVKAVDNILNSNLNQVSKRNFEFVKQYSHEHLEEKRNIFYSEFLDKFEQ